MLYFRSSYSLVSWAFLKAKNSVCGMRRILKGFKIPLFPLENLFIFIDKYLKFKEIEYFDHYDKSEMR